MTFGFYGLLLALMAVMKLAPDSWAGRALNRELVERPLEQLGRMERHHLIFLVIIAGFMMAGGEIFALGGTEMVLGFAIDASIYLDAVLVTYALTVIAGTRNSWQALRMRLPRLRKVFGRRRIRSAPTRRPGAPSANDEEHSAALPLAA